METMTAAFSARPPVRLDNMIVYSGPPATKNHKIHPPRPAPTSQVRHDSLPAGIMGTVRAGFIESSSGFSTSNDDNHNDFTADIATFTFREAASHNGPLDTSIPTETNDYYSIADMSSDTATQLDMRDDIANRAGTRTAGGSVYNESTRPAFCSTIDVQPVCARTMSSADLLADLRQRAGDNIECTPLGNSPSSVGVFKSPSPAAMQSHAYSADNAVPVNGSIGRDSTSELAQTDDGDVPFTVPPAMRDFPKKIPSVCVALEAQPHQSSTIVGRDLQDKHWVHDQGAVTGDDATPMLAGDHSCSASDQENSLHETIRAGRGATIAQRTGSACDKNGMCDSSDEDIVPWKPKRRRALPVGSGSADKRASSQPLKKRKRRQMYTAEPADIPTQCLTAASHKSSRPTSRHVAAARRRPRKISTPVSTSTQDEAALQPPRALGFRSEPTWEVDRIVGSARRRGKVFYEVQWKHTWEPAESLQGSADAAVAEFRLTNRCRRIS